MLRHGRHLSPHDDDRVFFYREMMDRLRSSISRVNFKN